MRTYVKPIMDCEIFAANEFIAACYRCNVDATFSFGKERYDNDPCGTEVSCSEDALQKVTYYTNDGGGDFSGFSGGNPSMFGGGDKNQFGGGLDNVFEEPQQTAHTAYLFVDASGGKHLTDGVISSNHS